MVFDASLLNTQHYKISIKGKVEQSREKNSGLPHTLVLYLLKREPSGRPQLRLASFIYIYIYIYKDKCNLKKSIKMYFILLLKSREKTFKNIIITNCRNMLSQFSVLLCTITYRYPKTGFFAVSHLFIVARHKECFKLESKHAQHKVGLSILPYTEQVIYVSGGIITHYLLAFVCLHFALPDTILLNLFEDLCITRVAAVNSFVRVLNNRKVSVHIYIYIYIYIYVYIYIVIQ